MKRELKVWLEVRAYNGHNRYNAPATYDSFSCVKAHLIEENRVIDNIIVPVGAYGKEFADNLAKSTLFIVEGLETVISDEAQEVADEHHEVLREFTARGRDAGENLDARSTIQTIQEGVLSIVQVAALLTADKVEGYSDPSHLLHDVIDQRLIEKVTRLLPMALIGPHYLTRKTLS